jgi:uncharacterized membrane protein
MNVRQADFAAPAAAVLCAVVTCVAPWVPVRAVAATPLCLVLPGYALTRAIFAGSAPPSAQPSQTMRLTLTFALSLTTLIVGSLALDLAPGGLQRTSWAVLLAMVTALASSASVVRRGEERGAPMELRLPRPRIGSIIIVVLAGIIAVGAFVASRFPLPARNAIGYTQLWILPASGSQHAVEISVVCDQLHTTGYRLDVRQGKRTSRVQISLRPGDRHELTVPVLATTSTRGYVTATLYRDGQLHPYRQVRLAADRA